LPGKRWQLLKKEQMESIRMKNTLAVLALCAAPLLAHAQNCTGDNADTEYILGETNGITGADRHGQHSDMGPQPSVMHWATGLVWHRCTMGQDSSGGQCTGSPTGFAWTSWADGLDLMPKNFSSQDLWGFEADATFNLLESGAWRMAYVTELQSIMKDCSGSPKINRTVFPNTPAEPVWSGSPGYATSGNIMTSAYYADFSDGSAALHYDSCPGLEHPDFAICRVQPSYLIARSPNRYTRFVRGGQPFEALAAPPRVDKAANAQHTFAPITLASASGTTAWGGARIEGQGSPAFQVNGGGWVQEAIVKSGDQITVRMTAGAAGTSREATLKVRSGETTGTTSAMLNEWTRTTFETTAPRETTATFALDSPQNGACGSSHTKPTVLAPTDNLCSAGTAANPADSAAAFTWQCLGLGSGSTTASCSAPRQYNLTIQPATGGSIGCTPNPAPYGQAAICTATPDSGYQFAGWGGACSGTPGPTCGLLNVAAPITVSATFTRVTYPIAITPATGGSVACTPSPVPHGDNATCTATPGEGYHLASWASPCDSRPGPDTCVLAGVTQPRSVAAVFALNTYPTAASADPAEAGRVVCVPETVPHGGSATCKALSNAWRLAEWAGDCAGQSGPVCTLNNVTAAPAVTARFDTGAPIAGPLNDTGLTACDATGAAAQDCHHGRDAGAATGQLAKQGASSDARNGFDFTKISNTGAELPASTALGLQPGDWACTRDNLTGLVWEVKTAAGLRGQNWIYTWHDPHSPDGDGGQQALWDECETEGRCDTAKFVEDVNAAGLCGAHDWRLPTVQELESLVDMGRAAPGPAIDPVYFPDMDRQTLPLMIFWSSTPYAGGGGSPRAWFVDFDPQGCGVCPLERAWSTSVRLVRTGR
jgi:hypothetical protein